MVDWMYEDCGVGWSKSASMLSLSKGKREDSGARESCWRFGNDRREERKPGCEDEEDMSIVAGSCNWVSRGETRR